jgi:hypothetical protein
MFTATSFPIVSGVYTGTGNFQTLTNGVSTATPITVQLNLQQGATVLDPSTGTSKPSNIAIGGNIRVQGFPCFTSGTANTTPLGVIGGRPSSYIAGNIMIANFTMDDGSMLGFEGALTDSTESHISAHLSLFPSGKCGGGPYFFPQTDLTRQN